MKALAAIVGAALLLAGCDGRSGPAEFDLTGDWRVHDSDCYIFGHSGILVDSEDEWLDGSSLWPVEFSLEQHGDQLVATDQDSDFALRLDGNLIDGDYEEVIGEFGVAVSVVVDGAALSSDRIEWNVAAEISVLDEVVYADCDMVILRRENGI